jgi:hypothetical protein
MLTTEQQRRLTEFLGECWHEYDPTFDGGNSCPLCRKSDHHQFHRTFPHRLDFSDWRVVMRLWFTYFSAVRCKEIDPTVLAQFLNEEKDAAYLICLAIDAYLVEKEKQL